MRARSIVIVTLFIVLGCRLFERSPEGAPQEGARPHEDAQPLQDEARPPPPSFPRAACIHQRRADLGAPVHRERGGRGGFVRLGECTNVTLIEGDERWYRVSFPLTDDRTEGWISQGYVMDCGPCGAGDSGANSGEVGSTWPPQPRGMCQGSGATGREQLVARLDTDHAIAGGGAQGIPGVKVIVVSYNLWELYDGRGGDRYLAKEAHGATPAAQYEERLSLFAKALAAIETDLLLLQEVEGASVACAIAHRAWPRSGWSCYSTQRSGASPQNVAIASRLKGRARWLHPRGVGETGPRGALELSLEEAGGLTVTAVHLKSSRGLHGGGDCSNARQRMGAAAALASRYGGWSSVLIAGDYNIDPDDTGRTLYDRTADILRGRGFERMCSKTSGCRLATYVGGSKMDRSSIDLAFFRAGGLWRAERFDVLSDVPHRGQTPLASDHLPVVVELRR